MAESTWQLVASLVIMPVVGKYVCMYVVLVFQNGMVFQGSLKWPMGNGVMCSLLSVVSATARARS